MKSLETVTLEVRRNDISRTRLVRRASRALADGEVLVAVDRFALTANNITYGVAGDKIGYWRFFPAEVGWGIIPVWGFADVVSSRHAEVPEGERLYGYFPMGSHLVLQPEKVGAAYVVDGAPHRQDLPSVYNTYSRVHAEPGYDGSLDDERMLLFPLYATSYCLYDFLLDRDWFGARQVVITSASSKTAIGLAIALADDDKAPRAAALTSGGNRDWVDGLGLYAATHTYVELEEIDAGLPTVIVDMSGNGAVLSRLHAHLGDNMLHCAKVGITHYDESATGPGYNAERSRMFFAPAHIQKRAGDWGPGVFQARALKFWREAAMRSRSWLQLDRYRGASGMEKAYREVLVGQVPPDRGIIVEPRT